MTIEEKAVDRTFISKIGLGSVMKQSEQITLGSGVRFFQLVPANLMFGFAFALDGKQEDEFYLEITNFPLLVPANSPAVRYSGEYVLYVVKSPDMSSLLIEEAVRWLKTKEDDDPLLKSVLEMIIRELV